MEYSYDVDEVPQGKLPSIKHDIKQAKMFLMKDSPESGDSLYNHLSELLNKILSERPNNAVDIFEEYSKKIKEQRYKVKNNIQDFYIPIGDYDNAKKIIKLFRMIKEKEKKDIHIVENEEKKIIQNLFDLFYYFEQIDIGLPRSDLYMLNLSIRKLVNEKPITKPRFWGKILGKPKNFYVLEAEFTKEELSRRLELEIKTVDVEKINDDDSSGNNKSSIEKKLNSDSTSRVHMVLPNQNIPPETIGTGTNKKVYYVCNFPGLDEWIELPSVLPLQITLAKKILHYFTGCLDTLIHTYPLYPGNEGNYLRSQIARISAATLISPIGFYTFENEDKDPEEVEEVEVEEVEEDEEEEEDINEEIEEEEQEEIEYNEIDTSIISENHHYKPLPVKELVDPSMSNWCHHSEYILSQGRTVWWNSTDETEPKNEDDEDDDKEYVEEEEEQQQQQQEQKDVKRKDIDVKKEIGPPLLTPLSEDIATDGMPYWTARLSSSIQQDTSFAVVRSNIWPGAFSFANDKTFANIYIGTGHKYNVQNFSPPSMPPVQEQYKVDLDIMEAQDPSIEEEETQHLTRMTTPMMNNSELDFGESFEDHENTKDQDEESYESDEKIVELN
ncbi:hypothetical protein HCN44_000655 [Aphidius gifuensis]|uniref:Uncharacterized protein n=1 Tax=Aphidius gifuensis TaxID=684658 RepID=A0A834XS62_APHGI|nr:hypothetical protein HCN44_000655 [Aphidius gifuensis]